jgi:hypothetical protein
MSLRAIKWLYKMGWEHNDRMIKSKFNEFVTNISATANQERMRKVTEAPSASTGFYMKPNPDKYYAQLEALENLYDMLWPERYNNHMDRGSDE